MPLSEFEINQIREMANEVLRKRRKINPDFVEMDGILSRKYRRERLDELTGVDYVTRELNEAYYSDFDREKRDELPTGF